MDLLKNKVFGTPEQAKDFKPIIYYKNKTEFNRLKGLREVFNFYIFYGNKKVKYDAIYEEGDNDYLAVENDKDSPSGLDIQYDFYHGKSQFEYDYLQNATVIQIYFRAISEFEDPHNKVFVYPLYPYGLDVVSHKDFDPKGKDIGKFYMWYLKGSDSIIKSDLIKAATKAEEGRNPHDLPSNVDDYFHIMYSFYRDGDKIIATEKLDDADCETSGYYYWANYGDGSFGDMISSDFNTLGCYTDEALNKIKKAAEDAWHDTEEIFDKALNKAVKETFHLFGEGLGAFLDALGIGNVLLIGGLIIVGVVVGGVVLIKVI